MTGDVRARAFIEGDIKTKATIIGDVSFRCIIGNVEIGRVSIRHEEAEPYEGEYVVTPSAGSQILETANKKMINDFEVKAIPYYDISNEYGRTIYIGGEP